MNVIKTMPTEIVGDIIKVPSFDGYFTTRYFKKIPTKTMQLFVNNMSSIVVIDQWDNYYYSTRFRSHETVKISRNIISSLIIENDKFSIVSDNIDFSLTVLKDGQIVRYPDDLTDLIYDIKVLFNM